MLDGIARPFGILLMWLYEFTHNYGLAVILFALIVKLILLPFMMKSKYGMMRVSMLQPKMKALEKKYSDNKLKYQEEVQKLYKDEGVNPASGCIWSLIPYPILIALYSAIRKPLTTMMGLAASELQDGSAILQTLSRLGFNPTASAAYLQIDQARFISNHFADFANLSDKLKNIDYSFLGLDLGVVPDWKFWAFDWTNTSKLLPALGLLLIPVIAAFLTWLSTKINVKMNPNGADAAGSMMLMMPLMTLVFAFWMPAALGIYWAANTLFSIVQDVCLTKHYSKIIAAETAERDALRAKREAELEAKRKEAERLRAENITVRNENISKRRQQSKLKQERTEKAAEWARQNSGEAEDYEPSRVGNRRYARGRAYDPDRFAENAGGTDSEDASTDTAIKAETIINDNETDIEEEFFEEQADEYAPEDE